MISKKDLLKEMNISYGQLYRWKREGLIPDEWFNKQSVSTGQETFFERRLIIPRIEKILELKDKYQLEELRAFFSPSIETRRFSLREAIVLERIDPFILKMYSKNKENFTVLELAILAIFSYNQEVNFEDYSEIDFEKTVKTSDYFYILKNTDYFIIIATADVLLDKKIEVCKKIKIEDEVSIIASALKE